MEPQQPQVQPQKSSGLNVPTAILIAGVLIAVAIVWNKKSQAPVALTAQQPAALEIKLTPVTAADHILGNPDAPIKIVEYSDTSCPFCRIFHPTMTKIMDDYGKTGKIAWAYRHFPLYQIHPNANHEAQALECAADLGGNDKFWAFTKRIYEVTPSVTGQTPNGLDQKQLPKIAAFVGLDVTKFNKCLDSGKFKAKVDADQLTGINAGVGGTPFSFIVLNKAISNSTKDLILKNFEAYRSQSGAYPIDFDKDNKIITINGALPLPGVDATIRILLDQVK